MDKNNDSINVEKNNTIYVTDKDFEPMGVAQDWDIEEPSQSKKPNVNQKAPESSVKRVF